MRLLSFLFLLVCFPTFAQSADYADELFDNFEYANALNVYLKIKKEKKISDDSEENVGYCYYILGDNVNGIPFINSIMKENDNRTYLWLWKGTLEKESGDYDNARISLNKFLSLTNELNEEVNIMIQSCDILENTDSLDRHSAIVASGNHELANLYSVIDGEIIYHRELGVDKNKKIQDAASAAFENAELFIIRPIKEEKGTISQIRLFENFPYLSVNRVQRIKGTNTIVFSASDLFNKKKVLKAQQIYTAEIGSSNEPITEYELWEYAGVKDTSSCSHPAISSDGTRMVFAKSSNRTRGSDLFVSNYSNGVWSKPVELSSLNTYGNEMFPLFQGDSLLTFSSDGRPGYGGLDVYCIRLSVDDFSSDIHHYGAPINSTLDDYNFTWTDSLNSIIVSNRPGGKGDDDIWNIEVEPKVDTVIPNDGFDDWYAEWHLKPIYYDFDSFGEEANKAFIEGCIKYREKYGVDLILVGHTDSRGTKGYNLDLGKNRTENLKEQLINANVQNEIATESNGENELVNDCGDGKKCSDEEHQLNRFVLIEITRNDK